MKMQNEGKNEGKHRMKKEDIKNLEEKRIH